MQENFTLIKNQALLKLTPYFDNMARDIYYPGDRFKAISRFTVIDDKVTILPHQGYIQTQYFNSVAGNIVRDYPPINECLTSHSACSDLLKLAAGITHSPSSAVYTLHQHRALTMKGQESITVPEGKHQDGYEYVLLCCIARHNIVGGITSLYVGKQDDSKQVFKKILLEGEIVLVKDNVLYHYTTPVMHLNDELGYRDILVVTISQKGLTDVPVS
ncbi:hypothetical protein D5R81_12180 [Parashewanella spongiae]|uniref:2OG-Fe dioxygenase family protein n=1 Tax=Parashewanella spongiae TaxID=342950 RepID=A0A3A6TNP5_9GAMM|nr:2OG-Fe dioxygenase family protein [Parashewanella spongiae]MCL1078666.1 2OG-Fe dioxygenase family protein [Parashewanella spongiae]RJY12960.1 hypothetical protein D5R81_12180 [Parashewanella spongiae]